MIDSRCMDRRNEGAGIPRSMSILRPAWVCWYSPGGGARLFRHYRIPRVEHRVDTYLQKGYLDEKISLQTPFAKAHTNSHVLRYSVVK
eukprot:1178348-Prorocentrum_minimum.AAC.2